MIDIIDFTSSKISSRNLEYGGRAGEKRGILYNDEYWFLKFPKNTLSMNNIKGISYVTYPINEYIGCHIFKILVEKYNSNLLIMFSGFKSFSNNLLKF